MIVYFWINNIKVKGGPIIHMLDYSPTKTQKLLGNPDKSTNQSDSLFSRLCRISRRALYFHTGILKFWMFLENQGRTIVVLIVSYPV